MPIYSKAFHFRVVACVWIFAVLQDEKRRHDIESREHRDTKGAGEEVRRHHGDRERAERDKHKERRHREEKEEEERNHHIDKTSSKKSDKSHKHETKTEVCVPISCL